MNGASFPDVWVVDPFETPLFPARHHTGLPLDGCVTWSQVPLPASPLSDLEICCYSSPEASSCHSFFKALLHTIALNTISPSSSWPPLSISHLPWPAAFSNSIIFATLFKGSQPLSRNGLPCITFTCYTFRRLLHSPASRDSSALERLKKKKYIKRKEKEKKIV